MLTPLPRLASLPLAADTRFYFWDVNVLHNQPPARLLLIDRYGTHLLSIQQCRQLLASPESRRAFKLAVDKAGADVVEATPLELTFLKAHAGFPPKASSATLAPPAAIKAALRYRHYLTTDMERSFNLLRERGERVLQLVPEDEHALAMLEQEEVGARQLMGTDGVSSQRLCCMRAATQAPFTHLGWTGPAPERNAPHTHVSCPSRKTKLHKLLLRWLRSMKTALQYSRLHR